MSTSAAQQSDSTRLGTVKLRIAARTDVGRRRSENQDSYGYVHTSRASLYVVADGMGGARGGGTASAMAVQLVIDGAVNSQGELTLESLHSAIELSNRVIYSRSQRDSQFTGMGTTVVALAFLDDTAIVAHVGDSRIYQLRDGQLHQLTRDHTLVQELVDTGAIPQQDAASHPIAHMLTRSLGPTEAIGVEIHPLPERARPGDKFLLCSDGLYNHVGAEEIERVLKASDPDAAADELLNLALEGGGSDNVTIEVIEVLNVNDASVSVERPQEGGVDKFISSELDVREFDGQTLFDFARSLNGGGANEQPASVEAASNGAAPAEELTAHVVSPENAEAFEPLNAERVEDEQQSALGSSLDEKDEDDRERSAAPGASRDFHMHSEGRPVAMFASLLVLVCLGAYVVYSMSRGPERPRTAAPLIQQPAQNQVASHSSAPPAALSPELIPPDSVSPNVVPPDSIPPDGIPQDSAPPDSAPQDSAPQDSAPQDSAPPSDPAQLNTMQKDLEAWDPPDPKAPEAQPPAATPPDALIPDSSAPADAATTAPADEKLSEPSADQIAKVTTTSAQTDIELASEIDEPSEVEKRYSEMILVASDVRVQPAPRLSLGGAARTTQPDQPIVWENESKLVRKILNGRPLPARAPEAAPDAPKLRTSEELQELAEQKSRLRDRIADIDSKLEMLVLDSKEDARRKQTRLEMEAARNGEALVALQKELTTALDRHQSWEKLQSKSAELEPLKLADEVATLSDEVKRKRAAYSETTESYLKTVDKWQADPKQGDLAPTMASLGREVKTKRLELEMAVSNALAKGLGLSRTRVQRLRFDISNLERFRDRLNRHIGILRAFTPDPYPRRQELQRKFLEDRGLQLQNLNQLRASLSDDDEIEFRVANAELFGSGT